MTYQKIGFLAGVGGNAVGIGQYVRECDTEGVPAVVFANDSTTGVSDALDLIEIGSTVPHVLAYRVVRSKDSFYSVPNYNLSPESAAIDYYNRIEPLIPPEIKEFRNHVWILLGNELDKNKMDWLGWWSYYSALKWGDNGYKVGMVGFNSGEPEPEGWLADGMLNFLDYAGLNRDTVAVNLHEYSFNDKDIMDLYPWKVGRFQHLFKVCDEQGIPRPSVLIGEWGWRQDVAPNPSLAMEHIKYVSSLYSKYETILGATTWTLQNWHSNIYNQVQRLIIPVTDLSTDYTPVDFTHELIVSPEQPDNGDGEDSMTVFGIDVSHWQRKMNWKTAQDAGVRWAYIKATEGIDYVDDQFFSNWLGTGALKIPRGGYHFYKAWLDPVAQAEHFASTLPDNWELYPCIDLEDTHNASSNENLDIHKFLIRFEELTGVKPVIYTSAGYWNSIVGDTDWGHEYDLWVANWRVSSPTLPVDWTTYTFWQYDVIPAGAKYGAQSERIDVNVFNGSWEEFLNYIVADSGNCFPIEPFTSTVLLNPQELNESQDDWIKTAMTTGTNVDGENRVVGFAGWSISNAFKDILDAVDAGKVNSRLLILDGDQIGTGLTQDWMRIECPKLLKYSRWYTSDPVVEPPIPPDPDPPVVDKIDLKNYIIGDGRRYYLKNHNGSTQEILQSQVDGDKYFQVKNRNWESFVIDNDWIRRDKDTSPGGGRYYTQREPNSSIPAKWLPRHMALGEDFTVTLDVQFYNLDNCLPSDPNSGNVTDKRRLVKHYDIWVSRHGIKLNDVVEIVWMNGGEKYFYAKDYGLVGWERLHQDPNTPAWTAISEFVDGGNNERITGCFG